MDFTFTREQEEFREEIRNFCQTTPYGEVDANLHGLSFELRRKVADKGWLGLIIPKEYGGQGRSLTEGLIFVEEMVSQGAQMGIGGFVHNTFFIARVLLIAASEQQKKYYLSRMARGDIDIGQGFTEAVGGSDLLSNTTRAVREGDHYIINGEKMFNSWADKGPYFRQHGISQYVLFLARTAPSAPPDKSLSLFVFDATTPLPGMTVQPIITLGGMRSNEVFFDDVRIPADSLVGEENKAWDYVVESGAFYWCRGIGAEIATMRGLLQQLVQYAKETQVDGQPLSRNALVRHKLAEMAIDVEELRLHAYHLAWAFDKGLDITDLGAIQKFHSDRVALYFFNTAMQIIGPYGQLEPGAKYAPLGGMMEAMYIAQIMRSFSTTGPSAMPSVIAGHMLGLPNEFGLIY